MSNRIFDTVTESSNISAIAKDLPVYECYDAETGDLLALAESAEDMVGIYEAMHAYGMLELQAEANPYTVTTESVKEKAGNVFTRIKEMLKKLWAKIRSFFDNIIIALNAKFKSGKDFAEKYEGRLKKLNLSGFKAEAYPYTGLSANPCKGINSKCTDYIIGLSNLDNDEFTAHKEEYIDQIRGLLVGEKEVSSDEFAEKVVEKMRGASKKTETSINLDSVISILKDTKALKEANTAKSEMDEAFKKQLTLIEKDEKGCEKSFTDNGFDTSTDETKTAMNKFITGCQHRTTLFTASQTICTTYFGKWKNVYDERGNEYKRILVQAFKYKA